MPCMILPIHIAAGGLAMVLGAVALSVKKGSTLHRRSGMLFVCSMLVMGGTASILGFLKSPTDGNVFAGMMVAYFVGTAVTTVRPASAWSRGFDRAGMIVAFGLGSLDIAAGVEASRLPGGVRNGVPFFMLFFIGAIMLMAAIGDLRVMLSGMPRGGRRLARHLWRMCFATFIAAGSFFSIEARVAKILPAPFTSWPMRLLPIVLLFGAMFYWLIRVRIRRPLPVLVRHEAGR